MLLSLVIFLPALGALALLALPSVNAIRWGALGVTLVTFAISIGLWLGFDPAVSTAAAPQMATRLLWFGGVDITYFVGVDGLNLLLILLTTLLGPIVVLSSWTYIGKAHKGYYALMLLLETGVLGVFAAFDVFLFYIFFELTLIPMVFLIGIWGGEDRVYAAVKFVLYTLVGSLLMLVGVLWLGFAAGDAVNGGVFTTDWYKLVSFGVPLGAQWGLFAVFGLAFMIKVPLFPFHTWLPDAHTQAPTVGSVILAAVLLKLGTYGFVRIAIPILPDAAVAWAPWIGLLAVVGIIYGALGCLAQTDMKRLIAFSSVAHMGFVMLGIATLTDFGINAAIMGMVAHGLITGMLFFLAGSVKERFHTLEISRLGGLLVQAPRMGWIFGFCVMASLGLPGLAGFWGEFPAILSAYQPANGVPVETFRTFMVVAALGTVLAAGYLLWLLQRVAFGTPPEEFVDDPHITDTTRYEWISWAPLLALIVAIGVYPNLVFRVTDGAVDASLNECLRVDERVLTADEVEALGCSDVYDLGGGGSDAPVEHAAGN